MMKTAIRLSMRFIAGAGQCVQREVRPCPSDLGKRGASALGLHDVATLLHQLHFELHDDTDYCVWKRDLLVTGARAAIISRRPTTPGRALPNRVNTCLEPVDVPTIWPPLRWFYSDLGRRLYRCRRYTSRTVSRRRLAANSRANAQWSRRQ